ncbi:RNA export factor GLE2 SCDLUD_000161 [Saccharomycodes ludwigii]|uniref:RNA export factor GLE2 n=1 Tax=Saccharomycodes ludwigii TaxID=36035 RepID=UPI001E8A9AED|nr:hypothetical protein SCDLUD_000161 [Saccharomycodes ludwigii]KAH3902581.1 hypothetical protein SCDLUD_000161 [Saccharomycodes ludwigii]
MSYYRNSTTNSSATGISSAQGTEQDLMNDITINNPANDSISDIDFNPQQDFLFSSSSWDGTVRIWDVQQNGMPQCRAQYQHQAPVLTNRWSTDGTKVASAGCDNLVLLYDVMTQQQQQVGQHDMPVKSIRFVQCGPTSQSLLVSGSWDKTLRYWDLRQQQPAFTLQLAERVYDMDSKQKLLVVALAGKNVTVIDLNNPSQIFKQTTTPLKWQTRTVACHNEGNGFAIGSIEGRCAIQYIDQQEQRKSGFSFKCHRHQNKAPVGLNINSSSGTSTTNNNNRSSYVYSVNKICYHPIYGTFATAGGDGTFTFWDKDNRRRLKGYPSLKGPISAASFNRTGSIYAYAVSYDWSQGHMGNLPDYPNVIRLHAVKDEEVKGKKKT